MMKMTELSDHSRVWIFGADRALTINEVPELRESLAAFLDNWSAHKVPLAARADVVDERFLVIALDETSSASGCSIDTLFRYIGELERRYSLHLLDSSLIFYANSSGRVEATDRDGFKRLAGEGVVSETTAVYDPTLGTLGEVRKGFPTAAQESWHKQLLR